RRSAQSSTRSRTSGRPYVRFWIEAEVACLHYETSEGCAGLADAEPHSQGTTMQEISKVFVGLDISKLKISVALAEEGRQGEVRFLGDIDNTPDAMKRLVRKLSGKYLQLLFCYEAGPTGYGLHRQITALGHDCSVIAPSLIPKRSGEHVKTNRRDSLTLARLHRAGELTTTGCQIWGAKPSVIWCGHAKPPWRICARSA